MIYRSTSAAGSFVGRKHYSWQLRESGLRSLSPLSRSCSAVRSVISRNYIYKETGILWHSRLMLYATPHGISGIGLAAVPAVAAVGEVAAPSVLRVEEIAAAFAAELVRAFGVYEVVFPGAAAQEVVPGVAPQDVLARLAEEPVGGVATNDLIVTGVTDEPVLSCLAEESVGAGLPEEVVCPVAPDQLVFAVEPPTALSWPASPRRVSSPCWPKIRSSPSWPEMRSAPSFPPIWSSNRRQPGPCRRPFRPGSHRLHRYLLWCRRLRGRRLSRPRRCR